VLTAHVKTLLSKDAISSGEQTSLSNFPVSSLLNSAGKPQL
jgi:hypothetical protein